MKYDVIFDSLGPTDGKLPGSAVKKEMVKSKLPNNVLGKIWSALSTGGSIIIDDYYLGWCAGVKQAVDEFVCENSLTFNIPKHSHQAQDDYWYFRNAEKSGWALALTKE